MLGLLPLEGLAVLLVLPAAARLTVVPEKAVAGLVLRSRTRAASVRPGAAGARLNRVAAAVRVLRGPHRLQFHPLELSPPEADRVVLAVGSLVRGLICQTVP